MSDLTEFLLARIAEDEQAAREAIDPHRPGTHWMWIAPEGEGADAPLWLRTVEEFPTASGVGPLPAFPLGYEVLADPTPAMGHIARHDPARVLAECEAKRRIMERHSQTVECGNVGCQRRGLSGLHCLVCDDEWPCPDLRQLAAVHADHPDYREEWR